MKIGVTSQNFRTITSHAGKARRFLVFSEDGQNGITEIDRLELPKAMSIHEFQGDAHPIDDFDVLISGGCGNGFRRKMVSRGVKVITTSETDPEKAATAVVSGISLPEAEPHTHEPLKVTLQGM
jgi:predicted Fe-Mo cluster-binding NifX family protein